MYSGEDLEIKCESKTMKLACLVEMQSLLLKGFTFSTRQSPYFTDTLKSLNKFWDGIFAYQKDGNYPIDNNMTERTIRKLTTQRNNSLHYRSDEGVEMAVAYHSVIPTVKLHGISCWDYLGKFSKR